MLYLSGVYDNKGYFWPVKPPTKEDLDKVAHTIAKRVSRYLERAGYLYRDAETEYRTWCLMKKMPCAALSVLLLPIGWPLDRIRVRRH
ncbi:MAG TPA: hypothetical protein EYQ14_02740 [Gammaproteobacteria bacterium]|nr:hypothetical protein [Gammaproteobacteria bacterium]